MIWTRRWDARLTAASAALALALGLAAFLGFRAVRVSHTTLTKSLTPAPLSMPAVTISVRSATAAGLVEVAIESNPFRPERAPAEVAFRLPSDQPATTAASKTELPIILVGTAVLPDDGSFAMCRVGGEPARVVRIGDRIGEYTLRRVNQGLAQFESAQGRMIEISVPKAGS